MAKEKNKEKLKEIKLANEKLKRIQLSTRTTFKSCITLHNNLRNRSKFYYNWHLKKYTNAFHFGVLVAYLFLTTYFTAAYFFGPDASQASAVNKQSVSCYDYEKDLNSLKVKSKCSSAEKAAEARNVNKKAQDKINELSGIKSWFSLKSTKQKKINELKNILEEREKYFSVSIKDDPKIFLDNVFSKKVKKKIPNDLSNLVEKIDKKQGKFSAVEIEDFKENFSKVYSLLDAATGKKEKNIYIAQEEEQLGSYEKVEVYGYFLGENIVLANTAQPYFAPLESTKVTTTGEKKVIVAMGNFTNDRSQPFTKAEIESNLFLSPDSTNLFFQESSFGKVSLSGTVVDNWIELDIDNSNCMFMWHDWSLKMDNKLLEQGIDVNTYDHKMYIYPKVIDGGPCNGGAVAMMNDKLSSYFGNITKSVFAHEIGHNFGLNHAKKLNCGEKTIINDGCSVVEYGDFSDAMGSGNYKNVPYHFNAKYKNELGWISDQNVKTVIGNGTYTIDALETSSAAGTQLLKISKSDTDEFYLLDFRKKFGFDSQFPVPEFPDKVTGTHLRLYKENLESSYYNQIFSTYMLDATPDDNGQILEDNWDSTMFLDGLSFVDEANGITVKQISHTEESVTLEVTFARKPIVLNANSDQNMQLKPSGQVIVYEGDTQKIEILPINSAVNYRVKNITIDGKRAPLKYLSFETYPNTWVSYEYPIMVKPTYTFPNIKASHTFSLTSMVLTTDMVYDFRVTSSSSIFSEVKAGQNINFELVAHSDWTAIKTNYAGKVYFASSDKTAVLPKDDLLGWVDGKKTFNATFNTVGLQTIIFVDETSRTYTAYFVNVVL